MTKGSVLITGCSDGGIGSALALTFQQQGYHVFATARNVTKMNKLCDLSAVTLLPLDVNNVSQVESAIKVVQNEAGGKLNYLIHNAATAHFLPMLDEKIEDAKRIFETNVWSPLSITQAFAEMLIQAKGQVVFITTAAAYVSMPWMGTYAMSKASLGALAGNLRLEFEPFGVKVLTIITGGVKSNAIELLKDNRFPSSSRYLAAEPSFINRVQGKEGVTQMETMEYARRAVADIIKGKKGTTWQGAHSGLLRFLAEWVPTWVSDSMMMKGSGLDIMMKRK